MNQLCTPQSDVIVHEGWNGDYAKTGNDIALIRLPNLAKTIYEDPDQIVMPVCLGWDHTIKVPSENHMISGWGRTNNVKGDIGDIRKSGAHSAKLKKLVVPVVPLEACKTEYPVFRTISKKQICAGGEKGIFWGFL